MELHHADEILLRARVVADRKAECEAGGRADAGLRVAGGLEVGLRAGARKANERTALRRHVESRADADAGRCGEQPAVERAFDAAGGRPVLVRVAETVSQARVAADRGRLLRDAHHRPDVELADLRASRRRREHGEERDALRRHSGPCRPF
jgi:hypothetical protein